MPRIVKNLDIFLEELPHLSEPLILYGAGRFGEVALRALQGAGYQPVAFCDRSPGKLGTLYHGLPVIGPGQLANYPGAALLLTLAKHNYPVLLQDLAAAAVDTIYALSLAEFTMTDTALLPEQLALRAIPSADLQRLPAAASSRVVVLPKEAGRQPLVSILMPVYNGVDCLKQAVDSVRGQSLTDWELLIVDDGSTDETVQQARQFAEADSRIRVILQPHSGVSIARNSGVDQACGVYLAFLDADDYWISTFLARMVAAIDGADLAVCGYRVETGLTSELLDIAPDNPYIQYRFTPVVTPAFTAKTPEERRQGVRALLNYHGLYPLFNKLYRMDVVIGCGLRFDPNITCWGEDELWNLRYLQHCDSIHCVEDQLGTYTTSRAQALSYAFDPCRLDTERQIHQELSWLLAGAEGPSPANRRLLGEILVGKLILLMDNDQLDSPQLVPAELVGRWQHRLLKIDWMREALSAAGLWGEWLCYLYTALLEDGTLLGVLLPPPANTTLSNAFANAEVPSVPLGDLLLAAGCLLAQDSRQEQFFQKAVAAGGPELPILLNWM